MEFGYDLLWISIIKMLRTSFKSYLKSECQIINVLTYPKAYFYLSINFGNVDFTSLLSIFCVKEALTVTKNDLLLVNVQ